MNINDYRNEWDGLRIKRNLVGENALEAVRQDGHMLLYVKEQTEEICLEAVRRSKYALQYVESSMFSSNDATVEAIELLKSKGFKIVKE